MNKTMKPIYAVVALYLCILIGILLSPKSYATETTQTTASAITQPEAAPPSPIAGAIDETKPTLQAHAANPYGLQALWREGDLVAKTTLFILVLMSIGSWYIIITKFFQQAKIKQDAKKADRQFWDSPTIEAAPANLEQSSVFRFIAEKGIHSTQHHEGTLLERIDFNTWVSISIQRAIDKIQGHLSGGLAFLATVGSTAPFVGLFGTVWGIYHALTAIGVSGQASIDKVAGPVGEALIMTAIGLAVAVPAVLGYNWLSRRNKGVMDSVRSFGSDLHTVLLSGDIQISSQAKHNIHK